MRFLNKRTIFCYFIVLLLILNDCNGGSVRRLPRSAEEDELTIDRDFTLKRVKPPVGKAKVPSKSANAEFLNSFNAEIDEENSEASEASVTPGTEITEQASTGKETNVLPEASLPETTTFVDSELTVKPEEVSQKQIKEPVASPATETSISSLENGENPVFLPEVIKETSSTLAVQNPGPEEPESPISPSETFAVTPVESVSSESTVEAASVQAGPSEVPNLSPDATEAQAVQESVSESTAEQVTEASKTAVNSESSEPTIDASTSTINSESSENATAFSASSKNSKLSTEVPEAIESSSVPLEAVETTSEPLNSEASTSIDSNAVSAGLAAPYSPAEEEISTSKQNEVTPASSKTSSAPGVAPEPSETTESLEVPSKTSETTVSSSEAITSSPEVSTLSASHTEDAGSSSSLPVAAKPANIASQTIEGSISSPEGAVVPQTAVEEPSGPQEGDSSTNEETTAPIDEPGTPESPDSTAEPPNGSTASPDDNKPPAAEVATPDSSTPLPEASQSSVSKPDSSTSLPSAPEPSAILIPPPKDVDPTSEVVVQPATSSSSVNVAPKGPQGPAEPSTVDPFYLQPFPTFSLPIITELPGWTGQMPDDIHVFDPLNELQHVQIPGYRGAVEESWKSVHSMPGAIGSNGKLDPVLAAFPPAHYLIPYDTFLDEGKKTN